MRLYIIDINIKTVPFCGNPVKDSTGIRFSKAFKLPKRYRGNIVLLNGFAF